ncbi:MAG: AarF/ABC1/UbiB kinase family protein [Chloroflexi bacterium]|nr:AarF/ABC1/UbiB kinase family protein [Chloroflexota bacterium]
MAAEGNDHPMLEDVMTTVNSRTVDPVSSNGHTNRAVDSPAPAPNQIPEPEVERDNGRYLRILTFFGKIILQIIWWDLLVVRIPLIGNRIRALRPRRYRRWSRQFRGLALQMGGVMIKLGQFLSARVDVLPVEVTEELQGLQDEVPAEDPVRMLAVAEAELGTLSARFAHIEETPLAAASFGQAHRAWLLPANGVAELGEAVVIKVQRPNIEMLVQTDLAALRIVARWIMRYRPIGRRADVPALMEEFAITLWEELDYESEADNAERFAKMYANDERIYIPAVYRQHSTKRVIVLENVESIKITDMVSMMAAGIDPKEVAACLLTTYFDQIFQERFFHADPHPGNLFVRAREDIPWEPKVDADGNPMWGRPFWLIFVDFGMVGKVPDLVGDNLKKVIISVTQRDPEQLTVAYNNLGFFLPGADLERITEAQGVVLDRIYGRNLLELARPDADEMQELGQEFRDLLYDFPFQVPQDFIYLGRAMGMVSGLVSLLDEQINPWFFIEKFGKELISGGDGKPFSFETAVELIRPYLSTPGRIRRIIQDAERGRLRVQSIPDKDTVRRQERLEKRVSQLSWSILGAASMLSATLIYLQKKSRPKDDQS